MSFVPRSPTLGVVLPSNSPGVHSLWVPAIALKTALVLKPGTAEPWTPYRLVQAFVAAGAPPEAFGFYPTDHAGAGEILRRCGSGMVFGDVASTRAWQADPRVEVHGPGYSKVLLGPDMADEWAKHLDVMASSIAENGGRSCVNASGVWTAARGREIAEALAARLAAIVPRAEDDPARPARAVRQPGRRAAHLRDDRPGPRGPGGGGRHGAPPSRLPASWSGRARPTSSPRWSAATRRSTRSRTASSSSRSPRSSRCPPTRCPPCSARPSPSPS